MSITKNNMTVSIDATHVQWNSNSLVDELSFAVLRNFSISLMDYLPSIYSSQTLGRAIATAVPSLSQPSIIEVSNLVDNPAFAPAYPFAAVQKVKGETKTAMEFCTAVMRMLFRLGELKDRNVSGRKVPGGELDKKRLILIETLYKTF